MIDVLPQGAVIGILGGGQLGRMLSVAAARLGYRSHVFEPSPAASAADVAHSLTTAAYEDIAALERFAASVDVITYEFENIPADALDILGGLRPIYPGRAALRTSQDRLVEKDFLTGLGLGTAPYAAVDDEETLARALHNVGAPAILKTRRFGYDGKGQARLNDPGDVSGAWKAIEAQSAILEGMVDFSREISVIAARGRDGSVTCYDPGENIHDGGILRSTRVPATVSPAVRSDAVLIAARILGALDYVGVLGVELFVTREGLLVNEIAPRVHNTGHWTQNGCVVDQFEQHIRAIAGLPLGDGTRYADIEMSNLIGADVERVPDLLKTADTAVHLYGKTEVKPGRKMGHVNRVLRRVR